ncbi:hypothetical protein CO2235_MP80271 [Cupriavidus oxalaticus]|uniref:Bacterial transcriptional activator domain-containing protein n=1 Tax=Cupriavidus oxalaticus TaxID=96344 RepID=A0A375GJ76_9BURK|nr:hypothetical protein CO2235_MP80271 [Cupriavidus oxalaticus]
MFQVVPVPIFCRARGRARGSLRGIAVESHRPPDTGIPPVQIRMLGPLGVRQQGVALPLPASRKVRALLAYLALAPRPVLRSQLCELLWEVPNDPRGELRWCLSRIRKLIDSDARQRLLTSGESIWLDLADGFVDALAVSQAMEAGVTTLAAERQRGLAVLFEGDFLEGLDLARCPAFSTWLTAQRRRFRACHAALLEQLAQGAAGEETFGYLDKWRELAPFDQHVHATILAALARQGRLREGEEHVAATTRLFEAEGLDSRPIRNAWRSAMAASAAWRCCSKGISWKASTLRAARRSARGSPRNGGASAPATPHCWSSSRRVLPARRRSATWTSGANWRHSTSMCTPPSLPRLPARAAFAKGKSMSPQPLGCSRPKGWTAGRSAMPGARPWLHRWPGWPAAPQSSK